MCFLTLPTDIYFLDSMVGPVTERTDTCPGTDFGTSRTLPLSAPAHVQIDEQLLARVSPQNYQHTSTKSGRARSFVYFLKKTFKTTQFKFKLDWAGGKGDKAILEKHGISTAPKGYLAQEAMLAFCKSSLDCLNSYTFSIH